MAQSLEHIWDEIDAAIIATPPWLHYRIAMPLLARGIHVLCEKPLAESAADARAMIDQAGRSGAQLCVNHTRRAFPSLKRVKELLDSGAIGECTSIEHTEGARFAWPSATGWHFARANGAKGVPSTWVSHVFDTTDCWWLDEKPAVISCSTDSFGGPRVSRQCPSSAVRAHHRQTESGVETVQYLQDSRYNGASHRREHLLIGAV